ncbi:MAG TPA: hypothetical protein PKE13_11855 [Hyphomicrobium zavarzinii]|nr:hypothetical protein [Hyphomicrobium zavarzinii]
MLRAAKAESATDDGDGTSPHAIEGRGIGFKEGCYLAQEADVRIVDCVA